MKFLLVMLAVPIAASAQIGIDEYRQSVVDYSYKLKESSLSVDYAESIYKQSRSMSLPMVSVAGDFAQQMRASSGRESWSFALQPQVSQNVYDGGLVRAEIKRAELGVEIAELNSEYDLLDLCYTADYAFYNLAAMRKFQSAVSQYVEIVAALKSVVQLRYDEGYISKSDLLMIETRLNEAEYEQIAINEDYTIALQKFNILRGYMAHDAVVQVAIAASDVVLPRRFTLSELVERRPDLLALQLSTEQARCSVSAARAAYNPKLSVGVMGSWQSHVPNVNGSTIMNGALFVKLSAPIFHFGERRNSVAAYQSLVHSSELSVKQLVDDIRLEESNMWATIVDSRAQMESAQRALVIGGENLEISTFAYSEGLTTILDVMQAQISWLQLYTNSIWSEFNYLVAISAYRRIAAEEW